jgi:nucleoside-diphosphate-sugar epimerase
VWHVPSERARSQREVVAEVSRGLERPVSLSATPPLVLRLVGLFQPAAAELLEMKYEFDRPFVVDDALTRRELGVASTPFAEALGTTVGWFRSAAAGR